MDQNIKLVFDFLSGFSFQQYINEVQTKSGLFEVFTYNA